MRVGALNPDTSASSPVSVTLQTSLSPWLPVSHPQGVPRQGGGQVTSRGEWFQDEVLTVSSDLGFMGHDQLCGFGTVTEHLWLRFQETKLLSFSASKSPSQLEPQLILGAEPLYSQKSPSLWPTQDRQPRGTEAQVRAPEWTQWIPSPSQQVPRPGVRGGAGEVACGGSRYSLLVLFGHLFRVRHGLCSPSRKRKMSIWAEGEACPHQPQAATPRDLAGWRGRGATVKLAHPSSAL